MPAATVTLPDGRKAEVTGPTRESILQRVNALRQETTRVVKDQSLSEDFSQIKSRLRDGDAGDLETMGRSGVGRFLDNIFEAPEDILNFASEQAKKLPTFMQGAPIVGSGVAGLQNAPDNIDLPNPTANDVFAGAQMAGEGAAALRTGDFGQFSSFQDAQNQQQQMTEQSEEQNPISSAVGQMRQQSREVADGLPSRDAMRPCVKPPRRK